MIVAETKKCGRCQSEKKISDFHKNKNRKDGHNPYCKPCKSKQRKDRYKVNGEIERVKNLNRNRLTLYGLTVEEYQELWEKQDGLCAICGNPETNMQRGKVRQLGVDHNHETGKVRLLLCRDCNLMLGNAKENPELLRKAAEYIEQY